MASKKSTTPKLLFLSHTGDLFGGAERSLKEIVLDMTKKGCQCMVVVPKEGNLARELRAKNVRVQIVPFDWWLRGRGDTDNFTDLAVQNAQATESMLSIIMSFKPNACITNTLAAPWLAYAASMSSTPHIWIAREGLDQATQYMFRIPFEDVWQTVDMLSSAVFGNSAIYKEKIAPLLPKHRDSIGVVTPYVPEPKPLQSISIARDNVMVAVGQIKPSKKQKEAVEVVHVLNQRGIKTHLVLVGDQESPDYYEELREFIARHKLEGQIEFTGFNPNPFDYMQAADINLVTSNIESFGRVTVEAMYSNKPLVAAAGGGTLGIVKEDETALLYMPGNINDFADKVERLLKDKKLGECLAAAANKEVRHKFSIESAHKELVTYLDQLQSHENLQQNLNLSPLNDLLHVADAEKERNAILKRETELLQQQIEHLQQELHNVYSSKAWKSIEAYRSVFSAKKRSGGINALQKNLIIRKSNTLFRLYKKRLLMSLFTFKRFGDKPGEGASDRVAVVMCMWKRIERLPTIIDMLNSQTVKNFDIYIWNNNGEARRQIADTLHEVHSKHPIYLYNSRFNVGGFGRFYIARKITRKHPSRIIVFLDDDQNVSTTFVQDAKDASLPATVSSFWAYKIKSDYWDRQEISAGEDADYCGTGGMVIDPAIFSNAKLFQCPEQYWFIEDLWLSFFAKSLGWKLTRLETQITFVDRDNDQGLLLVDAKREFYAYLKEQFEQ